jgi:hypothetical protein
MAQPGHPNRKTTPVRDAKLDVAVMNINPSRGSGRTYFCKPDTAQRDSTARLRMQSEAKRSRRIVLPAICDLQGDLHKVQGEARPLYVKFRNGSKML